MVAIKHGDKIIPNPEPSTVINRNDIAYLLGKPEMIAIATDLLSKEIDQLCSPLPAIFISQEQTSPVFVTLPSLP